MNNLSSDIEKFESFLEHFHLNSKHFKEEFLSTEFKPLRANANNKDISSFILQFYHFLDFLMFFKDSEIISKLRMLGFTNNVLKWMVPFEDIELEIKRLNSIEGLSILPYNFLFASMGIVNLKFKIELIEGFGMSKMYNNTETNPLFVDSANRQRRRLYPRKNIKKSDSSVFEMKMNEILEISEKASINLEFNKDAINKSSLQNLKGNIKIFTDLFTFRNSGISQNKSYIELFPLLKLILKDTELFDKTEFFINNNNVNYDGDYSFYKRSRVKKILLK